MVREKKTCVAFFWVPVFPKKRGIAMKGFPPRKNIHKAISQTTKLP